VPLHARLDRVRRLPERSRERPSREAADNRLDYPPEGRRNIPAQSDRVEFEVDAAVTFQISRYVKEPPDKSVAFAIIQNVLPGGAILFYFLDSGRTRNAVPLPIVDMNAFSIAGRRQAQG